MTKANRTVKVKLELTKDGVEYLAKVEMELEQYKRALDEACLEIEAQDEFGYPLMAACFLKKASE